MTGDYQRFLEAKTAKAEDHGISIEPGAVNPILKPHQAAIVRWMVRGGRRACFAAFGLGKSVIQLETLRLVTQHGSEDWDRAEGLIIAPLGVRQEFRRDAAMLGTELHFIRSAEEIREGCLHITNYETVRDGKLDPRLFGAVSMDEAAILRGFGGTKTFREFMRLIAGDDRTGVRGEQVPYRFVATATPSPNEYVELLAYADFLGVMETSEAKTRFFKRDSTKADRLTLHPHKEREFWLWVASWAVFVQKPSDLGPEYSDEGYDLPPIDVRWHELPTDHSDAGEEVSGQGRLLRNAALGITAAAKEKRDSLPARIAKLEDLLAEDPDDHAVIWHDLEDERRTIETSVPAARAVWGSQGLDEREQRIVDFAEGRIQYLAGKPVMLGAGVNLQRHCHRSIFLGIGFKFADFIQAIHRVYRFLQTKPVRVDLIYTEAEREIRRTLERKWEQHEVMVDRMSELIREYGLGSAAIETGMQRALGVERAEDSGHGWTMVHNDSVLETREMEDDSVDLIVSSIPFSTQYEYSPNYADLGHTDDNEHFWEHMSFLTPELLRVLKPGRVAAIHVKDRITPGGINGFGFQTVHPFSDECIAHFRSHGWAFLARKTIVTDVVRENNQTYRLGWTEQCKDGSRMGCGLPEYVLLFRKPPTDRSNGYADDPVVKAKPLVQGETGPEPWKDKGAIVAGTGYSRSRWQIDAHGFARSNGNRLLMPEDLVDLPHDVIFKLYRQYSCENVYDHEHHVAVAEALEEKMRLPVTFMLLPPQSWHPDVWSDVVRMRTLNTMQAQKGQEQHLCPMPLDLVERIIVQHSQPGELVYDPFGGIGTTPYCAVRLGRRGRACELSAAYWADGVAYCQRAEQDASSPTLFDLLKAGSNDSVELEEAAS